MLEDIIGRPLTFYFGLKGEARSRRVRELLDLTHLPSSVSRRLPGDLSGGQKQRVNLARALAAKPDVLLCDEVTSALDTVVAAAILDLIVELRRGIGLTTMFISHDLKTVRAICDDVLVLYAGRVVETLPVRSLGAPHHHPYTQLLQASVPELRTGWLEQSTISARGSREPAGIKMQAAGCAFADRCAFRIAGTCDSMAPPIRALGPGRVVACHRQPEEL